MGNGNERRRNGKIKHREQMRQVYSAAYKSLLKTMYEQPFRKRCKLAWSIFIGEPLD